MQLLLQEYKAFIKRCKCHQLRLPFPKSLLLGVLFLFRQSPNSRSVCPVFIVIVEIKQERGSGDRRTDKELIYTRQWDQDENAKCFRPSDWQMGPHLYISGIIREKDLVTSPITGRIDPFMSVFTTAEMASGAQKPWQNSKLPRRYQLTWSQPPSKSYSEDNTVAWRGFGMDGDQRADLLWQVWSVLGTPWSPQ